MSDYVGVYKLEIDTGGKVMFPAIGIIEKILKDSLNVEDVRVSYNNSSVSEWRIKEAIEELTKAIIEEAKNKADEARSNHEDKYHWERSY